MRSELHVKTNSFKLYLSVGACLTVIIIAMFVMFAQQVAVILLSVAGVIVVSGIVATWARFDEAQHRRLMRQAELAAARARVRLEEYQAKRALFVEHKTGTFVLGDVHFSFYPATVASRELAATPQLTAGNSLDLLSIFTQATQSYAIIGGQQVGKTYQARRVASHWLQSGIKPIVIGPKWDKGEWDNCALFGGEYNFERVSQGLRIVKKLATDRHADKSRGHKTHPIQPIFFDDWTAIRAKLEKEAEEFIIDATTLYASVNIILYFIIHLDTANAWGVGKVGAALHRNFYKLFIETGTSEAGLVDRSKNRGFLCYPGEARKDGKRIALFNGVATPDLILSSNEAKVLEMLENNSSRSAIARAVFGDDGGNQLKAVNRIIASVRP